MAEQRLAFSVFFYGVDIALLSLALSQENLNKSRYHRAASTNARVHTLHQESLLLLTCPLLKCPPEAWVLNLISTPCNEKIESLHN